MKKILMLFLLAGFSGVRAQPLYNPQIDGNYVPAKIIFGNGVIQEMQMQYRSPEYFKNPQNRFKLAKSDGTGGYDQVGGIEAFMVDNKVWALRTLMGQLQFVAFIRQGAIEEFHGVVNGKMGVLKESEIPGAYMMAGKTKRYVRNNLRNEIVESPLSVEKLKEWIADSQEVMDDLNAAEKEAAATKESMNNAGASSSSAPAQKGLLGALEKAKEKENQLNMAGASSVDVSRIINNYNVWYEQRNPNKIKYYFSPAFSWIYPPAKIKSTAEIKAENKAKLEKAFAGRTNTVSPEMASAKDNIPVKKETFSAKLNRVKKDGNKVGVLLELLPARSIKPDANGYTSTSLIQYAVLEGEYLDESLRAAGQQVVDELNAAYKTTDFELIDMSQIPYKEVKVLGQQVRVDDWWASKYKVVAKYTLDPRLEGENKEISGKVKFVSSVNFLQMLVVTEYIGGSASTKQDILTQILNFGSYRSSYHTQDDQIKEAKEMYEKVLSTLEVPILDKLKAGRMIEMPKLQKRLGL